MSESIGSCNLDYLDDRTKHTINGYIRESHKLFSDDPSSFSQIPTEINTIILLFIDDYFMLYRGSYQWRITNRHTIQSILKAQQDQCFTSDVFEMSKLKWMIRLYPNGNTDVNSAVGQFDFYVEMLSLPTSWDYVLVQQTLHCHEANTTFYYIQKYQATSCMSLFQFFIPTCVPIFPFFFNFNRLGMG